MDQDVRSRGTQNATKMEQSVVRTNGPRVVVKRESPLDDKRQSLTPTDPKNGSKETRKDSSRNESKNDIKDNSDSPRMSSNDAKASPNNGTPTSDTAAPLPKASRKSASQQKSSSITARPIPLFGHFPDATEEATSQFQVITDCLYGAKHMGSSDHDAFECDCSEEWQGGLNQACGEDSDCINRATKMECVDGDCNCGEGCQNQRFQRKQYASVSVIKTEKKGFGLRTDSDLQPNDFIFEYIGEVINEPTFRRRMLQYDDEGIKHFYFMSLTKNEFVDATRKGNLSRFCNHSCNPNCYVDKWVVGKKLRMGIFATRVIRAGEELVFDYNVDRYGAEPQPCYCGEPNCTGFIGGKTQTERATKLPQATIEALGIDDPDSWDTAVAKRPRRKRTNEDDEEYVGSFEQSSLAEDGVTKVMAALMQCKEKWIAVKLLARIQSARDDERVINRVVRMHGYQILRSLLATFQDDENVVLQVLDILYKLPRLTKNKISDSNIETLIQTLSLSDHQEVASEAKRLLEEWSKLETAYRIPRKKVDPNAPPTSVFEGRRGRDASDEAATSHDHDTATRQPKSAPLSSSFDGVAVPRGPRSNVPQRNPNFHNAPPRSWRGGQKPNFTGAGNGGGLPSGWFSATDPNGVVYYYTKTNLATWKRPTQPADMMAGISKAPSKAQQEKNAVQEIIDSLTKETPRPSATQTPQPVSTPVAEPKKEKWQSLPIEKQMKIYENTLFPHIKSVTDRFRHRLPKDEIKKFGKEIGKKLVASDYKNNRVEDPNKITSRQEKKVKAFVRDFFERAAIKYKEQERRKHDRQTNTTHRPKEGTSSHGHAASTAQVHATGEDCARQSPATKTLSNEADVSGHEEGEGDSFGAGMMMTSDGEDDEGPIATPTEDEGGPIATPPLSAESELLDDKHAKRKRTDSGPLSPSLTPSDLPSMKRKRFKDEDKPAAAAADTPTPPPPPPPPPPEMQPHEQQQQRMWEQEEEELMRENEEAQRLEDEAAARRQDKGGPLLSSSSVMAVEGTAPELASLVSSMQAISRITRAIPQTVTGSGNEDGQR